MCIYQLLPDVVVPTARRYSLMLSKIYFERFDFSYLYVNLVLHCYISFRIHLCGMFLESYYNGEENKVKKALEPFLTSGASAVLSLVYEL